MNTHWKVRESLNLYWSSKIYYLGIFYISARRPFEISCNICMTTEKARNDQSREGYTEEDGEVQDEGN